MSPVSELLFFRPSQNASRVPLAVETIAGIRIGVVALGTAYEDIGLGPALLRRSECRRSWHAHRPPASSQIESLKAEMKTDTARVAFMRSIPLSSASSPLLFF